MITRRKILLAFLMSLFMITMFSFSNGLSSLVYADDGITGEAVEPTEGEGSEDSPYEIKNYDNLVWFQEEVDKGGDNLSLCAKLTADIIANRDLLANSFDEDGNVKSEPQYTWTPICQSSDSNGYYSGTFDGNGYSISGLYYNDEYMSNVALFGCSDGTIKNLIIKDSYFNGNCFVSTFVGTSSDNCNCTIENCGSSATIKGVEYCGGIAGDIEGEITNCYFIGKIEADYYANAISNAALDHGYLDNCFYLDTCGLEDERATSKTADELADICEAIEFHSYIDEKCLVCGDIRYKIVPICNFGDYQVNPLWTVFSMRISDEIANMWGYSLKVTLPNETEETYMIQNAKTIDMMFNGENLLNVIYNGESQNITVTDDEKATLQDIGVNFEEWTSLYVFPCNVEPWELTKDVKVEVILDGSSVKEFTFNVKDNMKKEIIEDSPKISDLLNYGAAVQKYFDYNTDNPANADIGDTTATPLEDDQINYLKACKKAMVSNEEIGMFTGLDVVLGTTITLNVYFEPADEVDISDLTFEISGEVIEPTTVEPKKAGDKYILSMENLSMETAFMYKFNFKASDNQGNELILENFNGETYLGGVFNDKNNEYSESLKQLCSKLYTYVRLS